MKNKTPEEYYDDFYKRRLDPNKTKGWIIERFFGGKKNEMMKVINNELDEGNKIKCGYFTTSIRGYHERAIMIKKEKR